MLDAEKEVIKLFEAMGKAYGIDSLSSKIFSIIYLEPEPICLDAIAKRTGYSLASISNKIRKLELFAPIIRSHKPGSKKVFISMEKEVFKILKAQLQKSREIEIVPIKNKLPGIIKDYKKQAKTDKDKKKIKILEQYYKDIEKFDRIMSKMLKRLEGLK
jgi:DNA-binding transcriptional regulator GbsR (MarR family)